MTGSRQESAPQAEIIASPASEARLAKGRGWLYEREIVSISGTPEAGDVVAVCSPANRLWGVGLYSPQSKIRVRLISDHVQPIDEEFWVGRLRAAIERRQQVVRDTSAYRLVNADGDALPGLIVDRYGDTLVMQTLTVGMERRQAQLADLVQALSGATAIYLRNDGPARTREGLPLHKGFLRGAGSTEIEITEGPARFVVDIERGQKTGWFCDQREHRLALAALSKGRDVLDVCCHTGAFGVQAAIAGARSVAGLDTSRQAIERARAHAKLNRVEDRCDFREADAWDALRRLGRSRKRFDVAVVDPPAFAKRRAVKEAGLDGYQRLHEAVLPLLREQGLLISCSCSHQIAADAMEQALLRAGRRAGRRVHVTERLGHAADHPIDEAVPESRYLTCLYVVVKR